MIRRNPLDLLKPYAWRVMCPLSLITVTALMEAVGLVFLSVLLNVLLNAGAAANGHALLDSAYSNAASSPRLFFVLVGAIYLVKTLLALWANYASFSLALRMSDDWRERLLHSYLQTPLKRLDKSQGAMLHLVLDEPNAIGLGLGAAGLLAQNALSVMTIYVVLLSLSPLVTAGLTVMTLASMMTVWVLSRYTRNISVQRSQAFSDGYGYIAEMLTAIKQLRIFSMEAEAERCASGHIAKMRGLQRTSNVIASSPRLLIEVIFLCGLAVMVVVLIPQVGEGTVLSSLGLTIAAAMRLLPGLSASAGTWVLIQHAWPALMRIADELARLESTQDNAQSLGQRPAVFCERIEARGLYFSYPDREQVLAGLDLDIPCGAFTGIVGPSGSGKSTLIDLLCGLYTPDKGHIAIDGVDLRQVSLGQWRKQLGVVSQDGFLMSGTIRDNLCLLRPDCPEDVLRKVVSLVGAEDFINNLPARYETRVRERGLTLSGGQRQRLALARVLLREPSVLILDEATNALDVESEESLQKQIEKLRGKLTLIVIAHRLSTVRRADHIYVLEGGRVIESGRHESLLRHGGLYTAMHRTAEIGLLK